MAKLISVEDAGAILPQYRATPIEGLLRNQNLQELLPITSIKVEMLIGTCMDYRINLKIPEKFAYVLRTAGGNLRGHEFAISYAIAVGGITAIALITHTDCGMNHVTQKRESFVTGLAERAGSSQGEADQQFQKDAQRYEIGDSASFVLSEAARFRSLYPKVLIAPLLYQVENDRLAQVVE